MAPQEATPFGSITLDAVDKAILWLLREDGRRSNADIARAVGVSQPTVRKRLDRIMASGVAHVTVHIDSAALGLPLIALVCLKVVGRDIREVGEHIAGMETVGYVGYLIGSFDLLVEANFRDNDHLFQFVSEEIATIEGVASADTCIVSRTEENLYWWRTAPAAAENEASDT